MEELSESRIAGISMGTLSSSLFSQLIPAGLLKAGAQCTPYKLNRDREVAPTIGFRIAQRNLREIQRIYREERNADLHSLHIPLDSCNSEKIRVAFPYPVS